MMAASIAPRRPAHGSAASKDRSWRSGRLVGWAAAALLLVPVLHVGPLSGQNPDLAPGIRDRVEAVQAFLDSRGPAAIDSFVHSQLSPGLASTPMDRHRDALGSLRESLAGGEIVRTLRPDPTRLEIEVRSRTTCWSQILTLSIEPDPPHRIQGLLPGPVLPPDSLRGATLTPAGVASAIGRVFDRLCAADLYSGAILLARRDSILLTRACGDANKDFGVRNQPDFRFNLASMSKTFTAVAIAQLVEAGKLSYRDSLAEYLPKLPNPVAAREIRIEHLLTHTSGLGSYFNREFQHSARSRFRTVDDYLSLVRGDSLAFAPGTDWRYSNTGYLALGKVIEVVSGRTYYDYLREHLFARAGMKRTGCYMLDRVNPGLVVGYEKEFTEDGIVVRNNLFEHVIRGTPAGGCYSTVQDLYRFSRALLTGRLMGSEHVERMLSAKPQLRSPRYGFGFEVEEGGRVVGHGGGFMGISTDLALYRDSGWMAVALSNYGNAVQTLMPKIDALLLDDSAEIQVRH